MMWDEMKDSNCFESNRRRGVERRRDDTFNSDRLNSHLISSIADAIAGSYLIRVVSNFLMNCSAAKEQSERLVNYLSNSDTYIM